MKKGIISKHFIILTYESENADSISVALIFFRFF